MRLPLDTRWSRADRRRYAAAIQISDFATMASILEQEMTPQQLADARRRAKEYSVLFRIPDQEPAP